MLPLLLGTLLNAACPISPVVDILPEFVAPMTGQSPAWLVDTSARQWQGANQVVKTLWIFSKKSTGPLHIEGRRLDGEGTLRFQDGGIEGTPKDSLEIPDPGWRRRAWPSNATPELRQDYAFVPNYVLYPSAGCWQFTVRIGDDETRITIAVK
jgi:hypothetical protein